ncbi:MAG: aminopeptidase [Pseudomonadota bacterium]|nr:aminopeptidase [Pseudomonadota bacterium]
MTPKILIPSTLACALVLAACNQTPQAPAATPTDPAMPASAATDTDPAAPTVDVDQLAERIVTQSAGVKEGDVVGISGLSRDADLLEALAVAVRKQGGFPMLMYSSERLSKRMFFDVPPKFDAQEDTLGLEMAKVVDVTINVGNGQTVDLFEGADPARMAARGAAGMKVGEAFRKAGIRSVDIGNGMYPAAWQAERMGLDQAALSKMFWDGINVDYTSLQARAGEVEAKLAAARDVHVTHPNGTDLRFSIAGRKVVSSDGLISEADRKAGGAALAVYLPAGEVMTSAVPGSASGKLVESHNFYRGKPVENLTMEFAGGKLVTMTGSGAGFADLKAEYDAVQAPGKDQFGAFDLGINPNIRLPADAKVGNWVPAGTVSVGFGADVWAGGSNTAPYGRNVNLSGATVTLDDAVVVDKGALKL